MGFVDNLGTQMSTDPEDEWGTLDDEVKALVSRVVVPPVGDRMLRFIGRAIESHEMNQLAFQAAQLIQTTLPHRNPPPSVGDGLSPGQASVYVRKNGTASLIIQSGRDRDGKNIGIPYGSTARLLVSFITREAIRKQSRHLFLGSTLTEFCRAVGLNPAHGGTMKTVREQLRRLLSCSIVFVNHREFPDGDYEERLNLPVATFARLWFWTRGHAADPDQASLFGQSEVLLNADFYDALIKSPVPLNMNVLKALRGSPLAIDIYSWGRYRTFVAKERRVVSWWLLGEQFGQGYNDIKNFKKAFKAALAKVLVADPLVKLKVVSGGVEVTPSRHHLRQRKGHPIGIGVPTV